MKNIIFIAPPAAGKGTQAKLVSSEYNIPHISTGDLLRDEVATESPLGILIKEKMDEGKLIDDEIVLKLLEKRLMQEDCRHGYILDGYPRSVDQAKSYEELLSKLGLDLGKVIFLDIDKDLALKRTLSRIVCSNCGSSYNLLVEELKPTKDGVCDRCGNSLKVRSDDNKETFLKRFDTYIENTKDLIDYYRNKGVLNIIKVDEGRSANDIFDSLKVIIND